MNNYKTTWITSIHVNRVRNLSDLQIDVCDATEMRHLILTGPNGAGKTSVISALVDHLIALAEDASLQYKELHSQLRFWREQMQSNTLESDPHKHQQAKQVLSGIESKINRFWGSVKPVYTNESLVPILYEARKFVIAYYGDSRQSKFVAPKNPEKPNLNYKIKENKVQEFLKFLVDLKVQQALARNEHQENDAQEIESWFSTFVDILRKLFHDPQLALKFDYRDYSFLIETAGKSFPFTGLSAGYSAALDIVADLILKMQDQNRRVRVFDMPGIVLVDEIETHLHLALQKEILPILTQIFPRVQFIVTTHSPFVLNSIKNAAVYDLVSQATVRDLTEYSYDALAEGFFGVETESGELKRRLEKIERILDEGVTDSSRIQLEYLIGDFEKIPDGLAPTQKARYQDLKKRYLNQGVSRS